MYPSLYRLYRTASIVGRRHIRQRRKFVSDFRELPVDGCDVALDIARSRSELVIEFFASNRNRNMRIQRTQDREDGPTRFRENGDVCFKPRESSTSVVHAADLYRYWNEKLRTHQERLYRDWPIATAGCPICTTGGGGR